MDVHVFVTFIVQVIVQFLLGWRFRFKGDVVRIAKGKACFDRFELTQVLQQLGHLIAFDRPKHRAKVFDDVLRGIGFKNLPF